MHTLRCGLDMQGEIVSRSSAATNSQQQTLIEAMSLSRKVIDPCGADRLVIKQVGYQSRSPTSCRGQDLGKLVI